MKLPARTLTRLLLLVMLWPAVPCLADGWLATPGGVEYRDLQSGSGLAAAAGTVATVHLVGWVGKQGDPAQAFVDTRREGQPVSFVVGTPRVMTGWNEGVTGMRAGGRRLLRIPPKLGFGARAVEDIVPANAHLVFVMELLAVRPAMR